MSKKHTQGRLVVRGGYSIYADDSKTPVACTCLTNSIPENDEANARRLVACWNALIDLPQEALDGGWTRAGLAAHALKLEQQRDELLEALRSVHRWMDDQADGQSKGGHATFDLMMLREQRDIARAAIAKVEAGK